jgi:hypothetical protein
VAELQPFRFAAVSPRWIQRHGERLEQGQLFRRLLRLHAAFAVGVVTLRVGTGRAIASETLFAVTLARGILAEQFARSHSTGKIER